MINPGILLKAIAENLPHMKTDQKSVTAWVKTQLEGKDTDTIVEGHNLSIKIQRAFEENIFRSMVGDR